MEIHTTKISQENCIVIPYAVRKSMSLKPGDEIAIIIENEKVILEKVESSAKGKAMGNPSADPDYNEPYHEDPFKESHADDEDETDNDESAITKFR